MSNENQSSLVSHYRNLLPKSIPFDLNLTKRCSSSSYRQRLKRLQNNCQLIRQRRRCHALVPAQPIELRSNVFQQRFYRKGSLESLHVRTTHWQRTNILQLSDEYLYKCKYAMYASNVQRLTSRAFARFLQELFSYPMEREEGDRRVSCQLCSYGFVSNEMYQLHLHRRSVSMRYRCCTCQSWIQSTNPCQAYSHLSSHPSTDPSIEQLQINSDWKTSLVNLSPRI